MDRVVSGKLNWWNNLPVTRKLYVVVGVMALLIATELFTLLWAMDTLSAVRAFVGGEGIWSKAQKDAILDLEKYVKTGEEHYFRAYLHHLEVPLNDHNARLELSKPEINHELIHFYFERGHIHPRDIDPMVTLIRRFYNVSYIADAIHYWSKADEAILQQMEMAQNLHDLISSGRAKPDTPEVNARLGQILDSNDRLTELENRFSSILGEASRWLEHSLMILLVTAVTMVESTGLLLTLTFGRGLKRALNELRSFAVDVGAGEFEKNVPVRSKDELGQLATALNKMANNLQESTAERNVADHANRVKSLFLANMSHEIRTPLNAIIGFVDLLKDSTLSRQEREKYLAVIERTGHSLATIINDVLDISKVEAGKMEIEKAPCSLPQILKDLHALLRLRCEEKGIGLKFEYGDFPTYVVTDATRLKQILLNVIGNAIKFTNVGSVSARFEARNGIFKCRVKDTGIGISSEGSQRLFQTFSQVDLSIRKQFGGTGLGLVLSKRLARLLGGDVILTASEPGRGSTFEVSVSVEPVAEATTHQEPVNTRDPNERPLTGKKVLVVEDSIDNQLLAEQYLIREGAEVRLANHGADAIQATTEEPFDLVLMDMQMPVMDGYSATTQLRKAGYQKPIIALTAHAMREDLQRCLGVGCDAYLSKPFRRDALISLVSHYCRKAA